jgi:serine protease inhibitor
MEIERIKKKRKKIKFKEKNKELKILFYFMFIAEEKHLFFYYLTQLKNSFKMTNLDFFSKSIRSCDLINKKWVAKVAKTRQSQAKQAIRATSQW